MALRPRSPKPADGEQINFYERMIARFGQPVLELASGTGNYLVTLSENDFDIAGTEKFDARFNISREKAKRRNVENNLHSADMRDFNLDQKFKLIFIAGNALQHQKTNAEVASCFASVKRHLAPGGKFIVEIFNPSVALLNRHPNERFFVGEYRTTAGSSFTPPSITSRRSRLTTLTGITKTSITKKNKPCRSRCASFSRRNSTRFLNTTAFTSKPNTSILTNLILMRIRRSK